MDGKYTESGESEQMRNAMEESRREFWGFIMFCSMMLIGITLAIVGIAYIYKLIF